MNAVFLHIKSKAETQDIGYSNIDIEYIKYNVDDIIIVAEVLSKVGPEAFIIRGYSEVTGAGGEQGVANISDLADEQGFEFISPDEFDRVKNEFQAEGASSINEMGSSETNIIDKYNDRQNSIEGKVESNDKAPLPGDKENTHGSIGRDESGIGKAEIVELNQKERETTLCSVPKKPEVFSQEWTENLMDRYQMLEDQAKERNRRILELQSQMDQQRIPIGELREVRFSILEKELCLENLLDEVKRGEQSKADMRLIPEIQNDLIILRGREKQILDKEKLEKAQIAKAVRDLIKLVAKATKKSPSEVIKGMKLIMDERKVKREAQVQLIEQQGANNSLKITESRNKVDKANLTATPNNPNESLDSETILAGIAFSGILIESGTKKFEDYVKAMIARIGPDIKPYLKQFYSMVRYEPGFDTPGMDSVVEVDKADIEKIAVVINKI